MTIQDAVLRLERAGSESSKTTNKLRAAVSTTADKLVEILDAADLRLSTGDKLSGTMAIYLDLMPSDKFSKLSDEEKAKFGGIGCYYYTPGRRLGISQNNPNGTPGRLWAGEPRENDSECLSGDTWDEISRENCLMFAKHVANGLLGLVAEWLERRTAADIRAIARLEDK
jgi:hypothetical protein